MTKVEEIARALCVEAGENPDTATPHNKHAAYLWQHYILSALAALKAMREPSEGMIDHADRTVSADSDNQQCPGWFSAAIDAAIAEHEGR